MLFAARVVCPAWLGCTLEEKPPPAMDALVLLREKPGARALMASSRLFSPKSLDEAGWLHGILAMSCGSGVAV